MEGSRQRQRIGVVLEGPAELSSRHPGGGHGPVACPSSTPRAVPSASLEHPAGAPGVGHALRCAPRLPCPENSGSRSSGTGCKCSHRDVPRGGAAVAPLSSHLRPLAAPGAAGGSQPRGRLVPSQGLQGPPTGKKAAIPAGTPRPAGAVPGPAASVPIVERMEGVLPAAPCPLPAARCRCPVPVRGYPAGLPGAPARIVPRVRSGRCVTRRSCPRGWGGGASAPGGCGERRGGVRVRTCPRPPVRGCPCSEGVCTRRGCPCVPVHEYLCVPCTRSAGGCLCRAPMSLWVCLYAPAHVCPCAGGVCAGVCPCVCVCVRMPLQYAYLRVQEVSAQGCPCPCVYVPAQVYLCPCTRYAHVWALCVCPCLYVPAHMCFHVCPCTRCVGVPAHRCPYPCVWGAVPHECPGASVCPGTGGWHVLVHVCCWYNTPVHVALVYQTAAACKGVCHGALR